MVKPQGLGSLVQFEKNCTEGQKRDFVQQVQSAEKQPHAECCPHTSTSEWRGHQGSVSSHFEAMVSVVDPLDGNGNSGPGSPTRAR